MRPGGRRLEPDRQRFTLRPTSSETLPPDPKAYVAYGLITNSKGPLSKPTPAAQPWRRECVFMPQRRPSPRRADPCEQAGKQSFYRAPTFLSHEENRFRNSSNTSGASSATKMLMLKMRQLARRRRVLPRPAPSSPSAPTTAKGKAPTFALREDRDPRGKPQKASILGSEFPVHKKGFARRHPRHIAGEMARSAPLGGAA